MTARPGGVRARRRIMISVGFVALMVASTLTVPLAASAAPSGVSPVLKRTSADVTADGLPTAQINGVAWSQAVVGNTVYVGGEFSSARPAGAPLGTSESPRGNLLAYDITTGELDPNFKPMANAQVKTVTASPDGTRLYVGGSFTSIDGVNRYRIAAFDTATGALVASFAPTLNATVDSISATNSVVYASGVFGTVNGNARSRLAAFSASDGSLLAWSPSADAETQAILVAPGGQRVIVGGMFANINGTPAFGSASLDPVTGTLEPWAVGDTVRDIGPRAAILSLSTDGKYVYGTGYTYGRPATGNFEGVFAAQPMTGDIAWLADCHGDSYGAFGIGGTVYVADHHHFCANVGGFPNIADNPYRADAFTNKATGTVQPNSQPGPEYGDFAGQPSPSLINWLPVLTIGTYTHQNQAAWTVTGNSKYVVMAGEFLRVNNTPQQGLTRFAVSSDAPNKQGPIVPNRPAFAPTATATSPSSVALTWTTAYDRDDEDLTYKLVRNDRLDTPVCTLTLPSLSWAPRTGSCTDDTVQPGHSYSYHVAVRDPNDNRASSTSTTLTLPSSDTVVSDGFDRSAANGWGTAPIGGAWARQPRAARTYVAHQVGRITLRRPRAAGSETLTGSTTGPTDIAVDGGVTSAPTGGGTSLSIIARQSAGGSYRLKEILLPRRAVDLQLVRVVGSRQTTLQSVRVRGLSYVARSFLRARFTVSGSGSSTRLTGTVWSVGSPEPSRPQVSVTDRTAALTRPGSVGLAAYLSGSSTRAMAASWDNVLVTSG